MKVLISGSNGLIGKALSKSLQSAGHGVVPLVRGPRSVTGGPTWDPEAGTIDLDSLEGVDAVVHLAGENISGRRWTEGQKARIRQSRVEGTQLLAKALAELTERPAVFISSSAYSYYGDCGEKFLLESMEPGIGFAAELCKSWEAATAAAEAAGIRVVHLRIGTIISRERGLLAELLPSFKLGLGARFGKGTHYVSWVSLKDTIGIIEHAIKASTLSGPLNVTAPEPVMNREFTATLARVLKRPSLMVIPPWVLRLMLGEIADEVILKSFRMSADRILSSGYSFYHPDLSTCLKAHLSRLLICSLFMAVESI